MMVVAAALAAPWSEGCDLCGCYTPQLEALPQTDAATPFGQGTAASGSQRSWARGLYVGLAEQFTHFGTVQVEGNEIPNTTGQHLDSSITQLVAGNSLTSRFALQVNVPFIYRSFERPEGLAIDRGHEAGPGDVSLLCKCVAYRKEVGAQRETVFEGKSPRLVRHQPYFTASAVLIAGVKFPTGSSDRLKEEFNEAEVEGAPESGIHGHDLALGTGSFDGIFGGQGSLRYRNFFWQADAQFALRSEGEHQYEYANDISWSGGPGYYFIRKPSTIVGLQCVCSGEHKGLDRFRGEAAEDTSITSVFLGPRLLASWQRLSVELGADIPVSIDNSALQVVPDYRVRGGIALNF